MAAYISAQVDAMRYFTATTGQTRDHWGFAWAPSNTTGLSTSDFATQTGQLLDRIAASIRDSAEFTDPEAGTGACGPPGADTLCNVDIDGATHNGAWRSFRTWTQPLLTIAPPTETVTAGVPSAPSTVSLTTAAGTPATTGPPLTVTLRSSSTRGTFSTSPAGPWTPTLALSVAPGVAATFYYRDTLAGSFTITASAVGATAGTQAVTVEAGPAARVAIASGPISIPVWASRPFSARALDAFGNPSTATISWSVTPRMLGRLSAKGTTATFTAGRTLGVGTVTAAAGPTITARAQVRVLPARMRVRLVSTKVNGRGILATVGTFDSSGRPVSDSALKVVAERVGRRVSAHGTTGPAGKARVLLAAKAGCYAITVTRARSQGFVWDGHAPRKRVCL